MRALIIDDSKTMRTIIGKYLTQGGFEIIEAANGREGLDRLKEIDPPDIVVVDWNMPEMDGLDFVRAVRSESVYDGLRLMMVTTEAETSRLSAALDAGVDEYVMKPFTRDVLMSKLDLLGIAHC